MCWADRATLIVAFLWGTFLFVLLGLNPSNPYLFSAGWFKGFAFLWLPPPVILWVFLRLVIGNKGAVNRY